ncbi:MAG: MFS transporter [Negativicutes bacterium]|nr:MFS transporter [Negativicutes bacterium]
MEKPTRTRHWVLFVICLIYFITYVDRVNISAAAPLISKDFNISKVELGAIFAAFSWSYFMFTMPAGMLGDKFGPRKVLAGIVVFWGIVDAITGFAWSFTSLLVLRFVFGMAEAGAFPNATRAFSYWLPSTERGFAQGLTHGFSRLGGAVTPLFVVAVMSYFHDWRPVFFISAGVAAVWASFWFFWYRDKPSEYKEKWGGINQAEIDLINHGKSQNKAPKLAMSQLLKSKNMWALCLGYFCYNYSLWIFLTWLPTYLVTARGFTIMSMGLVASLPLFAGTIGDTLGGWLSDKIWKRTKNGKLARRSVAMSGFLIAAVCMIPGAMTDSPYMSVFFLACALFGLEMAVGVFWATALDVGHEYAGTVSGTMNCIGNSGSAITPLMFGFIVQTTGSWMYPFIVASCVLLVGVFLWTRVNPELTIAEELGLGNDD